jgi:electron transport complex protein RnfA
MIDLLLIFLGAAYLENLVLAIYFDPQHDGPEPRPYVLLGSAGLLLVMATLWQVYPQALPAPPQARSFELALAFMTSAIASSLCLGDRPAWRGRTADDRLRNLLPLLVANLAVLAFAALDQRRAHGLGETLAACLTLTLAFALATVAFTALRHRLLASDTPAAWRGAPIQLLTAALMALAAMGFAGIAP